MVTETRDDVGAEGAAPLDVIVEAQNYEWGLQGSNSLVAKLWSANTEKQIDESKPYAEVYERSHGNISLIIIVALDGNSSECTF